MHSCQTVEGIASVTSISKFLHLSLVLFDFLSNFSS